MGCVGSDLIDVAQRVEGLPPNLQAAAAAVELGLVTTATDALSVKVARLLGIFAESLVIDSLDGRL